VVHYFWGDPCKYIVSSNILETVSIPIIRGWSDEFHVQTLYLHKSMLSAVLAHAAEGLNWNSQEHTSWYNTVSGCDTYHINPWWCRWRQSPECWTLTPYWYGWSPEMTSLHAISMKASCKFDSCSAGLEISCPVRNHVYCRTDKSPPLAMSWASCFQYTFLQSISLFCFDIVLLPRSSK
jgi:hypothetical protein